MPPQRLDTCGEGQAVTRILPRGLPAGEPSEELAVSVSAAVSRELGKAFKPDKIFFVDALPKTRSAKIVRRALRATALGADPGDLSSLENPESLAAIEAVVG